LTQPILGSIVPKVLFVTGCKPGEEMKLTGAGSAISSDRRG
jgi:hypothetical protein